MLYPPLFFLRGFLLIPLFFLLLGICFYPITRLLLRTGTGSSGRSGGPDALNGSAFLTISVLILLSLALLEAFSDAVPVNHRYLSFLLILPLPVLSISSAKWLARKSRENRFLLSFSLLTFGIFLFLAALLFFRYNSGISLSSRKGALFVLVSGSVIFLFLRAAGSTIERIYSRTPLTRNPKWINVTIFLLLICVVHVLLSLGISLERDGFRDIESDGPRLPNVALLVLDTARADRLSCYGGTAGTTPNIDELARHGVLFENTTSSAPWTIPSHASLFTGCYPSTHGATWKNPHLGEDLATMAGILNEAGYRTFGISNNPGIGPGTGFSRGFDHFVEIWRARVRNPSMYLKARSLIQKLRGYGDDGAGITNRMISRYFEKTAGRPFFLFVNYLEPHLKYHPPKPFEEKYAGRGPGVKRMKKVGFRLLYDLLAGEKTLDPPDRETLSGLYNGEIAYLDEQVGNLLEILAGADPVRNTLIIVTSDHGDNIGEHGLIDHQFSLHETLLRIPLILFYPRNLPEGRRISSPAQNVDILPTVLSLLERSAEERQREEIEGWSSTVRTQTQGTDLLDVIDGVSARGEVYAEYFTPDVYLERLREIHPKAATSHLEGDLLSVRTGHHKLILHSDGRRSLFDLSVDPLEDLDIAERVPGLADSLEQLLSEWTAALRRTDRSGEGPKIDSETRKNLEDLGYILE